MWLILIPFPVVVALSFAYFRPYKNNLFNIIDCLAFRFILALTMFFGMYGMKVASGAIQVVYALMFIPCLYFLSFILYKVLSRVRLFHTCCSRIAEILNAKTTNFPFIYRDDEDLPDRILNPDLYQPLFAATNNGEERSQSNSQPKAGVNSLVAYGSM